MQFQRWIYTVPLRLRSLFRRDQVEQELDEELQYHLDRKTEENIGRGMSPEEARSAAVRSMDGLAQRKEECRDMRRVNLMEDAVRDVRYGLRVLANAPGTTAVAVLTLALAIGANAIGFAALNAVILKPLHLPRVESLYSIHRASDNSGAFSYPGYLDVRQRNRSFEDVAAYAIVQAGLDTGENPSRAWVVTTSGNYFDVLGIQPHLGRFYHSSDEKGLNSAPYIVLSHAYWQTRFQGDPGVIGGVVQVNKHPFTIIGIAPPGFRGTLLFFSPDFYIPVINQGQFDRATDLNSRAHRFIFLAMGHLNPGVSPDAAAADLTSIAAYQERTYPKDHGRTTYKLARPSLYGDFMGRPVRAFVTALILLAGLILLAACANLGSLYAARAADRSREVALRLALGAGRSRILRQLLTEAVLISFAGGALGLLGSVALLRWVSAWQPFPQFPVIVPLYPDSNVYAIALLLAIVSGMLFGAVPVRQVLITDPHEIVKAGTRATSSRRIGARDLLVAVQIAICAVLVTSSFVAVRGLLKSMHSDFGFDPRNAILVETVLDMAGYTAESAPLMQKRLTEGMQSIPGVTSVGLVDVPPLANGSWRSFLVFKDDTIDLTPANAVARVATYKVSSGYLQTARTELLVGRHLTEHDDSRAPRVAIVNQEFARKVFGSQDRALGRLFKVRDGTRIQVIGIVPDGKYQSLTEDVKPAMFLPLLQSPATQTWMVLRSNTDPQQLAGAIRNKIRELEPRLPSLIQTWHEGLNLVLFPSRVATVALGMLGAVGVMLSLSGVFGMAAYSVSRRLKELGIRIALGAKRRDVLKAALGRSWKLLAFGSGAGLLLGVLATEVLSLIVYQATPRDPFVLVSVIAAMCAVGLLATWIPARRALSLNALALLREE